MNTVNILILKKHLDTNLMKNQIQSMQQEVFLHFKRPNLARVFWQYAFLEKITSKRNLLGFHFAISTTHEMKFLLTMYTCNNRKHYLNIRNGKAVKKVVVLYYKYIQLQYI